jgi:DNA-binding CsgD family transcriptional regulator
MPAATADRNTRNRSGDIRSLPLAAATRIWAGTIACINASGLLVSGATNREISQDLGCSTKTVEAHVSALMDRSGARSRDAVPPDRCSHPARAAIGTAEPAAAVRLVHRECNRR